LYIIVPLPLPLGALQIIVIDLGFELFLALAYAWEEAEYPGSLMSTVPRKPVTQKSIALGEREKVVKAKTYEAVRAYVYGSRDIEALDLEHPEKIIADDADWKLKMKLTAAQIRCWFENFNNKEAWDLFFTPREQQVLVDADVLCYAYLEIGILETIGCLLAYFHVWKVNCGFSPQQVVASAADAQDRICMNGDKNIYDETWHTAQSAYYFGILIQQIFNHFACKGSTRLPFGWFVLRNKYTWGGILLAIAFAVFIVYTPGIQTVFETATLSPEFWSFPLLMGVLILIYTSLRILITRRLTPNNPNMALPLDLHPTRFSTRSKGN
jgi:sodium/potassium-transporting ATPase subunit alpha